MMSTGAVVTVVGTLWADLEVRTTDAGVVMASFVLACSPGSRFDRAERRYLVGEPAFVRCEVWGPRQTEEAATRLHKGDRVIVFGEVWSGGAVRAEELGEAIGWRGHEN